MSAVRVIHVTNDIGASSGVGTFVRRLNDELLALGVDSRIVSTSADLNALPQPSTFNFQPSTFIVHIHGLWLSLHHAAARWARAQGAKLVWSTHGMTAPWSMRHKRWKKLPAWWLYQKRDLRGADLVHCTTELEVGWNRAFGLDRTCVVPLGTDLPVRTSRAPDSPTRVRRLLFVGRLYPVKAIDRLIRAFQMVPHAGWRLRIVGPDQAGHLADLRRIAGSDVDFVGPKFGDDLSCEYADCDCLALVSHTENFGATVADALAHGKPVITGTRTPWRIVRDRGCGWWVDNDPAVLSKALAEMMSLSDAARADLGEKGRALAEEMFAWASVGRAMLAAYAGRSTGA